jgi:hypothetical protein
MAIHIEDKETDRLARDFARRRKLKITAAIKVALIEAAAYEHRRTTGGDLEALDRKLVRLLRAPISDSEEVMPGVVFDYSVDGHVVNIELDIEALRRRDDRNEESCARFGQVRSTAF